MTNSDEQPPSVWAELRSQRDLLIEMKVKLDSVADHELRLRKLEERKFPLPTVAVLISLASLLASVIVYVTQ
jgi:hypothetical protein